MCLIFDANIATLNFFGDKNSLYSLFYPQKENLRLKNRSNGGKNKHYNHHLCTREKHKYNEDLQINNKLSFISAALFVISALSVSAQQTSSANTCSFSYRDGYRTDVELSWLNKTEFYISTSHGRSFGNGVYFGGGVGFGANFDEYFGSDTTYMTPVFADFKYTFLNQKASPFVGMRAGGVVDLTNHGLQYLINPNIGVDFGRFSLKVGYSMRKPFASLSGSTPAGYINGKLTHHVEVGIGIAF